MLGLTMWTLEQTVNRMLAQQEQAGPANQRILVSTYYHPDEPVPTKSYLVVIVAFQQLRLSNTEMAIVFHHSTVLFSGSYYHPHKGCTH